MSLQVSSPAFTTQIRLGLNKLLSPMGLQVGTTLAFRAEQQRLQRLREQGHWQNARYDQGIKFDPQKHLEFLRETCLPYKNDYSKFSNTATGDGSFYLDNGYFRSVDAEVLYSMIRQRKPKQVVEVGSGFSTRLVARAIREGGLSTKIISIDPSPRISVSDFAGEHIQRSVEDVDPDQIVNSLGAGDLLFVDSSHKIVSGGDIPYLFLEILPRLRKGVLVHVHDIFMPFDYPEEPIFSGWGWTEQYLVHAFLLFNNAFEILWPARYMWELEQAAVLDVIPADPAVFPPSSLWLEKVA